MSTRLDIEAYVTNFQTRVLQDAMLEATASWWRRRAQALEAAMPRAGDFVGRATSVELTEQSLRLAQQAQACRNHADLLDATQADFTEVLSGLAGHDRAGDRAA